MNKSIIKKKGFTLIELLAVLVVLAILAVIAIPLVTNVVNKARKDSYIRSIEGYARAVENAVAVYQLENPDKQYPNDLSKYDIETKGDQVECGKFEIDSDGKFKLDKCQTTKSRKKNKKLMYKYENGKVEEYEYTLIPKEYQQVEYIESTGTQYISTGLYPNLDHGYNVEFELLNLKTGDVNIIFGTKEINYGIYVHPYHYGGFNGQNRLTYGLKLYRPTLAHDLITEKHIFKLLDTSYILDDIVTNIEKSLENVDTGIDIHLFGSNNGDSTKNYSMKIYKFQVYNLNSDEILQDFIPCYRKSDGEIGMYDTVTKDFFTNQGTGEFLKGSDVNE